MRRGPAPLALAMVLFACVVVAATWPAVAQPSQWMILAEGRWDGFGVLWFGEHAWRVLTRGEPLMFSQQVAFPEGLDLRLADSFLFGLLYLPVRLLLSPVAAYNLLSALGIVALGAAGFRLARLALKTDSLAATACGLVLAFNALTLDYRVDGNAYLVIGQVLLALLATELVLGVREPTLGRGARAGALVGLLAWSSGYLAIDTAILGVLFALVAAVFWRRELGLRHAAPAGAAVLCAVLLALPWLWLVSSAEPASHSLDRVPSTASPIEVVAAQAVPAVELLVPAAIDEGVRAFRSAYLGLSALALAVVAVGLRRPRTWAFWAALLLVGVVLALGPYLRLAPGGAGVAPLPFGMVAQLTSSVLVYRMVYRFLGLAFLGLAGLVALALEGLGRRGAHRLLRVGLVLLLGVDALWWGRWCFVTTLTRVEVPRGYSALSGEGAVLDLWPMDPLMLYFDGLGALYQAHHGRPIVADFTGGSDSGEWSTRLAAALVEGDGSAADPVLEELRERGVSDVAVHLDQFQPGDAWAVAARLGERVARAPETRAAADDSAPAEGSVAVFHLGQPPSAPAEPWGRDQGEAKVQLRVRFVPPVKALDVSAWSRAAGSQPLLPGGQAVLGPSGTPAVKKWYAVLEPHRNTSRILVRGTADGRPVDETVQVAIPADKMEDNYSINLHFSLEDDRWVAERVVPASRQQRERSTPFAVSAPGMSGPTLYAAGVVPTVLLLVAGLWTTRRRGPSAPDGPPHVA